MKKTQPDVDVWDGAEYGRNARLQTKWALEFIQRIPLSGSEEILDVGCGDGRVTYSLANRLERGGRVVGLDSSESMISASKKLLQDHPRANVSYRLQDVAQLNEPNQFDVITSFSAFHWLKDQKQALISFNQALRSKGKLFLFFPALSGFPRFAEALDLILDSPEWNTFNKRDSTPSVVLSTPAELARLVQDAGLLLKRMEIVSVEEIFNRKEDFKTWLLLWPTIAKRIPPAQHDQFISQVVDRYVEKRPEAIRGESIVYLDTMMELELERS